MEFKCELTLETVLVKKNLIEFIFSVFLNKFKK